MAKQDKKTKIVLVGYTLTNGGLERVFSTVSGLLYNANLEVHVVVLENKVNYPYYGVLLNLGIYSKIKKYFRLKQYLKKNQFDYVIDFRHRVNPWMELLFIHYIFVGFKFIYTIHSSKLEVYLTSKAWVARQMLYRSHKIVAVCGALNEKIKVKYQFEKAVVIPNCVAIQNEESESVNAELSYNYCIAVGRLVKLKQFDKLIEAYSKSNLTKRDVHLVILGEGAERDCLEKKIAQLQLTEFVHLLGFKSNIAYYIKGAHFLILTSKYEGFAMVILEALNLGIPVVSFDCETGPSEMVVNEENGLLVENQNFTALQVALNRMIDDDALYRLCKEKAKKSVQSFSVENIQEKWLDLLKINTI